CPEMPSHPPAGEGPSDLPNVVLCVATVDAERVELHQFPSVVFVRVPARVQLAVEVNEHGGARRARSDGVAKAAERVGADALAIVDRLQPAALGLRRVDVEVVRPELDHDFEELAFRVEAPQNRRASQVRDDVVARKTKQVAWLESDRLDPTKEPVGPR